MTISLRMTSPLWCHIHADLSRPHAFAFERVGFLTCGPSNLPAGDLLLLAQEWHTVDDTDYIDKATVGACIGPRAFRKILQQAYGSPSTILHVHRHEHFGMPGFSRTDILSMREFVPGFFNACRSRPHGALVLSRDAAAGHVWLDPAARPLEIETFHILGQPIRTWSIR